MLDDIGAKYGCPVYATPVGEIHVAEKMIEVMRTFFLLSPLLISHAIAQTKAVIGGEGNGGVMLPDVHIGRDALVAASLTLQHLAVPINSCVYCY